MSQYAIHAEALSKRYVIGGRQQRYHTLREDLVRGIAGPFQRLWYGRKTNETIWALKGISFKVAQGEVVGIVGRNGAGKSTVLKILSRITMPTEGHVAVRGRVASLLEIGTGFHPELTGRENIFLNGAILGMTRKEIARKFDEILDFAGVERFIDTPVKRYSSGMHMRLAFAIAAHLETDILLVDEVLAVGDAEFQKKCLGKIGQVSRQEGRTALYVSHNLASIEALCGRCILISSGEISGDGQPDAIVRQYLDSLSAKNRTIEISAGSEAKSAYIESIEILDYHGNPKNNITTWDDIRFRVNFYSHLEVPCASVVIRVSDLDGRPICFLSTQPDQSFPLRFNPGRNSIDCVIRRLPFAAGDFRIGAALAIPNVEWLDQRFEASIITVHPRDVYAAGLAPTVDRTLLALDYEWERA